MKYKILSTIGKKFSSQARAVLAPVGKVDALDLTQSRLERIVGEYDVLIVGLGLNINQRVIERGQRLKLIATATTGLDHIDIDYARRRKIKIISLKGERRFLNSITGTAELAFGLVIDLLRMTPFAFSSVLNYEWDREKFRGYNLAGKILGVVGLGRLGRMMARYGEAFGMKVVFYDPSPKGWIKKEWQKISFDALLGESDIISVHVHLKNDTENMFNKKVFIKMKKTAYLVNTSRGKIVNEKDLLWALRNKKIAGYATDVLADELSFNKKFNRHPLVEYAKRHNNLIIVPHIGGMTYESREATDVFIAEKVKRFLIV